MRRTVEGLYPSEEKAVDKFLYYYASKRYGKAGAERLTEQTLKGYKRQLVNFILQLDRPVFSISWEHVKEYKSNPKWLVRHFCFQNVFKQRVLRRDKYKCQDCGESKNLEVHHIIPHRYHWRDGTDEETNLVTLCRLCHLIRHSSFFYMEKNNKV